MFDIQHDSPEPIHEQIVRQILAHVATGVLKAGTRLAEYRTLAQNLLTNPQVVAKAYADLEWEGVLRKNAEGNMEVTADAAVIGRVRQRETARRQIGQAVTRALAAGLAEAEIRKAVDQELTAATPPLSPAEAQTAIKIPTHATSHRTSQGIQILSGEKGGESPQPEDSGGGDLRPPGR